MAQTMCGIEFLGYVMSVAIVRNLCYYFLIPELWPFQNSQQGCTAGQYLTITTAAELESERARTIVGMPVLYMYMIKLHLPLKN
jgi:hypothetical protein|eukprot:COSAG06_NODE_45669_length_353_cov_0.578740_1_plen_84_part_00